MKMKIFKKVLFIVIMIFIFSGVTIYGIILSKANGFDTSSDLESKLIREKNSGIKKEAISSAKKAYMYLHNRNYQQFRDMFSCEELKNCYTDDVIDFYYSYYIVGDNFKGYKDCECTIGDNEIEVKLEIKGDYRISRVLFVLDKNYKMMGMQFNPSSPLISESNTYIEEYFQVGEHKLEGLLTLPKGIENPPVVVLVHGSGYNNADESTFENRPFADIAHGLAEYGVATLRYNERFYQYPEYAETNNTIYTKSIDDACMAVEQLSKDKRINNEKIFVAGHSLGGMVVPKIAELNTKVCGIISLAGTPISFVDSSYYQAIEEYKTSTLSDEEKEAVLQANLQYIEKCKKIDEEGDELVEAPEGIQSYSKSYLKSMNELNTEETLSKLDIPMLILQGKDDTQVYADIDYLEWQRILNNRTNCSFKLYDGLNHFFMKSQGYTISEFVQELMVPGHIDYRVIQDIGDFVNCYSK